ncbi:MAG: class I SAM-dependent methyltransferase [Egibacteraceae bacterium]
MTPQSEREEQPAAQRWVDARRSWAVPAAIKDAAPEASRGFDVGRFARSADRAMTRETPSRQRAREALPVGGSVLDVGCGAGAAGLPLVPPAALVVGVDPSPGMLAAFAERARGLGVDHREIEGPWPEVAERAPRVDVVVCHSVFFGIADLGPFAQTLTEHARARVVAQVPEQPPRAWIRPYWKAVHGVDLPDRPTADDAIAVLREAGMDPQVQRWDRPTREEDDGDRRVASLRRALYLGPDRDPEIRALLDRYPPPATRRVVTLWWDVTPSR